MSPGTVVWATPQHPTHGGGMKELRAVTTLEPIIISPTGMLSPCSLPPQKPTVPGQPVQIYFQHLCWRAGGDGTG